MRGAAVKPKGIAEPRNSGLIVQRMQIAHHGLRPFVEHMGINLGCRDIRMAQKLLDNPEVGTVLQQMRREGMTQDMG
jgi:hypothetical protein